jgi:hypothetical protein
LIFVKKISDCAMESRAFSRYLIGAPAQPAKYLSFRQSARYFSTHSC